MRAFAVDVFFAKAAAFALRLEGLMRFVFLMDPMAGVLPDKDTTFAFIRASMARDHQCLHCEIADLGLDGGDPVARVRSVEVSDSAPYFSHGAPEDIRLSEIDAVFIRTDPPFDDRYLFATLVLERLRNRVPVINDPRGLRDANEKLYALHFADLMPKTIVTSRAQVIRKFVDAQGGKAVIKPLSGAGGSGVMLLSEGDSNFNAIVEVSTADGRRAVMVQEYLPRVREGDKRVIVLDGKLLGAINRLPPKGDLRSNIHVGGTVVPTELTDKERAIVDAVGPRLQRDGLVFVGLDVVGERLTEVNVTSPTGIQELSQHLGRDAAADVIAHVESLSEGLQPHLRSIPPA